MPSVESTAAGRNSGNSRNCTVSPYKSPKLANGLPSLVSKVTVGCLVILVSASTSGKSLAYQTRRPALAMTTQTAATMPQ